MSWQKQARRSIQGTGEPGATAGPAHRDQRPSDKLQRPSIRVLARGTVSPDCQRNGRADGCSVLAVRVGEQRPRGRPEQLVH